MSEVNSPLGKKIIAGKQMRQFDIPDVEDEIVPTNVQPKQHFSEQMDEVKRAEYLQEQRKRSVNGKDRLNSGALERLSILLNMTQVTRIVDFGEGIIFTLKSLKSDETREVIKQTNKVNQLEMAFEMRRQYLARCIKNITEFSFEDFIASNNIVDKLIFVDELDDAVANRLYNEFIILKEETSKKYAIKNEDDLKEVVNNLKK